MEKMGGKEMVKKDKKGNIQKDEKRKRREKRRKRRWRERHIKNIRGETCTKRKENIMKRFYM